jgi:hypothetical protein
VIAANMRRACEVHDMPDVEIACSANREKAESLLPRIARNPADVDALKLLAATPDREHSSAAVEALEAIAPNDADVLRMRASDAIAHRNWDRAVAPLAQLVEYQASEPAAKALAAFVGDGQWKQLLPYLGPGKQLAPRVLGQMSAAQVPYSLATPFAVEALARNALDAHATGQFITRLQEQGAWVDAFAVWTAQHKKGVPLLFNGSFDEPFVPDGFDWQVFPQALGARAGMQVERVGEDHRGAILQVRLNGRRFGNPLIRQMLLLGPGMYKVQGEYRTRRLRMENGFAWVARCTGSPDAVGRSQPLIDSGGDWRTFKFDVAPGRGCGPVVALQLETAQPVEAETGGLGEIEFDALSVTPAR